MKSKEKILKSMSTLLYSWGSDTPPEVIWGLNELLDWLEEEYDTTIDMRFQEDDGEQNEKVLSYLENDWI